MDEPIRARQRPIQRQYPSMAFDSMRGKLMVFGGRSSVDNGYKNDIWEWSGIDATLTNRTTGGIKPDVRYQAALVYDSKRDRLLMFGGYGTTVYDDLWAWAPTTREWTQISFTGTRPTARYGHWMFYDPVRDKVYVLRAEPGRLPGLGVRSRANTWQDRTVTSPPAGVSRSYFDVAFDTTRGKIVMLGGYYNGVYNTDIWEWDTTRGCGRSRCPRPARRCPTVATTRRSHTTRSGASSCWSAATSRSRAPRSGQRFVGVGSRICSSGARRRRPGSSRRRATST